MDKQRFLSFCRFPAAYQRSDVFYIPRLLYRSQRGGPTRIFRHHLLCLYRLLPGSQTATFLTFFPTTNKANGCLIPLVVLAVEGCNPSKKVM